MQSPAHPMWAQAGLIKKKFAKNINIAKNQISNV
jgi:hypothetical protein